jgi:hypothetical protein
MLNYPKNFDTLREHFFILLIIQASREGVRDGRFWVAHPHGVEGSGMAGPGETLGSL